MKARCTSATAAEIMCQVRAAHLSVVDGAAAYCKECREEADDAMPDGLEELEEP